MIEVAMMLANSIACAVLWWVSASFFLARGQPNCFRNLLIQFGLAGVMASALALALEPWQSGREPSTLSLSLRVSGAAVAWSLYDYRFGVAKQVRALLQWLRSLPATLATRLHEAAALWRRWRSHR